MALNIWQWLFQSIPESLALASLAVVLAGRTLNLKSVCFIGLPYAFFVYLVRLLPIAFGTHFIIFIIVLSALLYVHIKRKYSYSILIAIISLAILAASEVIFVNIIYAIIAVPFEEVKMNLVLWIIYGWPHIILLFLIALFLNMWKKKRG